MIIRRLRKKKELLERKIGGKKSEIGSALTAKSNVSLLLLCWS